MSYIILIAIFIWFICKSLKNFVNKKKSYEDVLSETTSKEVTVEDMEKHSAVVTYSVTFIRLVADVWAAVVLSVPVVSIGVALVIVIRFYAASKFIKSIAEKEKIIYNTGYSAKIYNLALESYILFLLIKAVLG